jgi:hypothetical protein
VWVCSKPGEAIGRISGDATWKAARGEDGGRGGMTAGALKSTTYTYIYSNYIKINESMCFCVLAVSADDEGERLTCTVPNVETAKAAARQLKGMRLSPYATGTFLYLYIL